MGLVCAHRIASPITAYSAVTSIYLHLVLLFFIARTPLAVSSERASPMDKLPYNVHPGLPRDEFVQNLKHLPASELNTLRFDLFCVASNTHSLLAPEWSDIPLVTRKDTAIKSASHKISEDIWTIVSCIKNKQRIPRVLLRNGKRGKEEVTLPPNLSHLDLYPNLIIQTRVNLGLLMIISHLQPFLYNHPFPALQIPMIVSHQTLLYNLPFPALAMWILHPREKWPLFSFRER